MSGEAAAAAPTPSRERSVEGGVLRRLSVSQVAVFDAATGGCPRRWWFQKVGGRPEPTSPSQAVGTALHARVERWLLTGEDVLCPGSRAVRHLLPPPRHPLALSEAPFDGEALSAAGVPFTGKVDVLDFRDEHAGPSGEPVVEPGVVAVDDVKTTRDVGRWARSPADVAAQPQMVGYAELARRLWLDAELRARVVAATDAQPGRPKVYREALSAPLGPLRGVRVSHVYAQTTGQVPRPGAKSTLVLSVAQVEDGWARVEGVAREMRLAAAAAVHTELEPNYDACESYGGCPHRAACLRDPARVAAAIFKAKPDPYKLLREALASRAEPAAPAMEDEDMSLRDKLAGLKAGHAPTRAEVDAERAEILRQEAEDAPRRLAVDELEMDERYDVARSGVRSPHRFVGASKGLLFFESDAGERVKVPASDAEVYVSKSDARAPAAPATHAHAASAALPPDAAQPTVAADASAATALGGVPGQLPDGRCAPIQRPLAVDEIASRRARCAACGAEVKVKPQKLGDAYHAVVPAHARPAAPSTSSRQEELRYEQSPAASEAAAPVAQAKTRRSTAVDRGDTRVEYDPETSMGDFGVVKPAAASSQVAMRVQLPDDATSEEVLDAFVGTRAAAVLLHGPAAAASSTQTRVVETAPRRAATSNEERVASTSDAANVVAVFVDCAPDDVQLRPLSRYVDALLETIEAATGVMDVRCAPKDSPLAFGGWRGTLAAAARESPPAPGAYSSEGGSELQQVVVEALVRTGRLRVTRSTR